MTTWFRQHRESLWFRMPWHIEEPIPRPVAMRGLALAVCGTTMAREDRGFGFEADPPLDDRCPACQGEFIRGPAAD